MTGRGILHVTNGDSAGGTLRQAGIPGTVVAWADVLHEGPVPPDDDLNGWLEVRARFIAGAGWESVERARAVQQEWARTLGGFADYNEVVFWFEHDLFDQLLLIRHLAWLGRQTRGNTSIRLICIGSYPGIPRFIGLGQLTPEQLAPLFETRQDVTATQYEVARRAWSAFTGSEPTGLEAVTSGETASLPFLGSALRRFLEEYPDLRTGLPRTERHVLECLEGQPLSPGELFRRYSGREEAPFMGDTVLWDRLEALARDPNPLVALAGESPPASGRFGQARITPAGRAVLAAQADWLDLHPLDRWLGGVHLHPGAPAWRWDPTTARLVRSSP